MTALPHPELVEARSLREAGRFVEAARLAQQYVLRASSDPAGHAELGFVHLHAGRAKEAFGCLMQAIKLEPKNADHHVFAGVALEMMGRDGEAVTAFRTGISLQPTHADALERLGNMLRVHERDEAAAECFRRAADVEPDSVRGRLNRVKQYQLQKDWQTAETLLRETVAHHPDRAEAKRMLAAVLSQRGEFAEAIPLLEAATEGTPVEAAVAYYDLANAKRLTEDDQPMVKQMLALLDYRPLPELARKWLHFALGKAHDDLGDYEAAMSHFDQGNGIAASRRAFDAAHMGASVERMIGSSGADFLAAHRGHGSASELPVLIVGMPRSGTTLVEQILSSHGDVAAGDELTFWNRTAEMISRQGPVQSTEQLIPRLAADYTELLSRISASAERVTDKTPGNYLWLGLYNLTFPKGRIIHCRRHPVDTCLSNYFTNFMAPLNFTFSKSALTFYYRTYQRMMSHWREVLPPGVLLEVDYEELVTDRERVTRRMIDFLGLPWDEACLRPQDNQRIIRTASQWQARQPTYRRSVERWRRYEPWLGELRELLDQSEAGGDVRPESADPKIPLARRLRDQGRVDEAIATIQDALRLNGRDPVLYNELGTLFLQADRVADAVECLQRAIGLNPNFAVAYYNLGAAQERQGQADQAIASLRNAITRAPDLGAAHSRLGNLLHAHGDEEGALVCFKRASELLPNPADQELEQAKLLRVVGSDADAEAKLRHVVSLDPANPLAQAMLGDLLGESGRFDEALLHLRKAVDLDPERVGALYNMTMFQRITDAEQPLVDQMHAMLERNGRTELERTLLHFALGKAYDDLDEPAQAILHFDAGNAIEHARKAFDRPGFAAQIDRLIEAFPADRLAAAAAAGVASERPLFVLGMPRSGTTLVEQILSGHPQVTGGGELNFWTDAIERNHAPSQLGSEFLSLLHSIDPHASRVTDKNPFNFLAIGLIHLALPQARFIHCRRDPIDTCLSIYFTRFATLHAFAYDRGDLVFAYRQYERLMEHWRASLPASRLLEVDYEALTAEPEAVTRRMVAFSGLDWDDRCLTPEQNPRSIRTASLWQARQPVNRRSVERWRRYESWLGALQTLHA